MSIAKPFTFVANTHAKSSEVNANFDTVYSQVNTNISAIAQNATDIDNLENNKANINGSSAQRFAVADAITNSDAINKQTLFKAIGNSVDYISGFVITKDSGSPEDTIIVSEGSCYDSTKTVVLNKTNSSTKTNDNQSANATYYIYVIGNSTGSSIDILISTDSITPSLPAGYSLYRQIGNYATNSDGNISVINYFGFNSNIPSPTSVIVETYINGNDWYRIHSDGWCEQGGFLAPGTYGLNEVALLKNYKDINYNIHFSLGMTLGNQVYCPIIRTDTQTTSSFKVWLQAADYGGYWHTCGYIN